MRRILDYTVETFGFENWTDYTNSLIHKDMIGLFITSTTVLSTVGILVREYLGIKPVLIGAIILLLMWELGSGLLCIGKKKEKFSSNKFGRFSLKAFFWICLFYIIYSFRSQFEETNIIAFELFSWFHTSALVYMFLEYLVSVDENMATITGKPNTFLQIVIGKLKSFLGIKEEGKKKSVT